MKRMRIRQGASLLLVLLLSVCLLFTATGCTQKNKDFVAVLLPTKHEQRWVDDGKALTQALNGYGYTVEMQYANDDIGMQISQVENMIAKKAKAIIITPIDGASLSGVLKRADEAGISLLAYDRLIANTDVLDAYVTFDNYYVGTQQGQFIVDAFEESGKEQFNIELFCGDPGDNNAYLFFEGAMSVLQPYIDKGQMVIKSGQTDFTQCAITAWSVENAQKRMDNLITKSYSTGEMLDAILAPNDGIAMGTITALKIQGYVKRNGYPVITGQDASLPGVISVYNAEQSMTVLKDVRILSKKAAKVCNALLNGNPVEFDDTETYFNGSVTVPSVLCDISVVTKENIQELIVDSGLYTFDQIKGEQ